MIMEQAPFSQQEILEHAQGNVASFIVATLAYSKRQGFSFEEWARAAGALFAPGWDELADKSALDAARAAALNMASGGATGVIVSGDEGRAEVTARWPSDDLLAFVGVSRAEIAPFYGIFAPIAARLGLRYKYAMDGDRVQLTFAR